MIFRWQQLLLGIDERNSNGLVPLCDLFATNGLVSLHVQICMVE